MYVINSSMSIEEISEFLKTMSVRRNQIGPIKKDFFRDPETKKYSLTDVRLAVLDYNLYDKLESEGYGVDGEKSDSNFCIQPYIVKNNDFAHRRSSVMHYYFPLSNKQDNCERIDSCLNIFKKMKVLKEGDWFIHVNGKDGICEFSPSVKEITKVMIKIMIDNPVHFRVSWCRTECFSRIERVFGRFNDVKNKHHIDS